MLSLENQIECNFYRIVLGILVMCQFSTGALYAGAPTGQGACVEDAWLVTPQPVCYTHR